MAYSSNAASFVKRGQEDPVVKAEAAKSVQARFEGDERKLDYPRLVLRANGDVRMRHIRQLERNLLHLPKRAYGRSRRERANFWLSPTATPRAGRMAEPSADELRDIGSLAHWAVSSAKPGYGVEHVRDADPATLWQSEGAQPHLINIQFPKKQSITQVWIFADINQDDSYTPHKISIRAGTHHGDLHEVRWVELANPRGWQAFKLGGTSKTGDTGPAEGEETIRAHLLQIAILSNHMNGKDTHVRGVRIFAPRVYSTRSSMARDGSRELCDSRSPPPSGSHSTTDAASSAAPPDARPGWAIPPAADPADQFKYAPNVRGAARSGTGGTGGTGANDSRGGAFGAGGSANGQHGQGGGDARVARPAADEDEEDESQAQLEEDQRDEIILATSPALANKSQRLKNVAQDSARKDIDRMRLAIGHGSPPLALSPRPRAHKQAASHTAGPAPSSSNVGALFDTPAPSSAQNALHNPHDSAQHAFAASSKPRAFAPVHNESSRPSKRTSIESVDKQSKRVKTSDAGPAKGQDGAAPKATSTSTGRKTSTASASGTTGRSSSSKSASIGVAPTAEQKKKSDGSGPAPMSDIVKELLAWQQEKEARDADLRQLRSQLDDKVKEVEALNAAKLKLKSELAQRVKTALERAAESNDAFRSTMEGMKSALEKIKVDVGESISAERLRQELDDIKQSTSAKLLRGDALEAFIDEATRAQMDLLKQLEEENDQRQAVITQLRGELGEAKGNLAEAQSRLKDQQQAIEQLENRNSTLSSELDDQQSRFRTEKMRLNDDLDKALLAARERELEHEASVAGVKAGYEQKLADGRAAAEMLDSKVRELEEAVQAAEARLREKVDNAKKASDDTMAAHLRQIDELQTLVTEKEQEAQKLAKSVKSLQIKHDNATRELDSMAAELSKVKVEQGVAVEQHATRLKAIETEHEAERASLSRQLRDIDTQSRELLAAKERIWKDDVATREQQLQTLKAKVQELEGSAEALELERDKLRRDNEQTQARLNSIENSRMSASPSASTAEVKKLQETIAERDKAVAAVNEARSRLALELNTTKQKLEAAELQLARQATEHTQQADIIARLEHDLLVAEQDISKQTAAAEEFKAQADKLREKEAQRAQEDQDREAIFEKEKKQAVANAIDSVMNMRNKELMDTQNELKRLQNKHSALERRLQKAQNDLAKAKDRTVLNQHIASSSDSPHSGTSPQAGRNAAVDSDTGAVTVSAMKGSKQSPLGAKGSGKSVKIVVPDQRETTKHSLTTTTTTKRLVRATATTMRRSLSTTVEEEDEDEEEQSLEETLVADDDSQEEDAEPFFHNDGDEDEEDPIEPSNTPAPPKKKTPSRVPKTTYGASSRKKK
ncbi:Anaphase-promoting complex subunit 10 [Rhodotorula toruloides]|nr:Anaphase-promoting complex subunit 10 [Rhodotorula toruloides]